MYSAPTRQTVRTTINDMMLISIVFNRISPMIRIQNHTAGWPYNFAINEPHGGHFLNVSGVQTQRAPFFPFSADVLPHSAGEQVTHVQITDPWAHGEGSSWVNPPANGRMWLTFDVVFRAMTAYDPYRRNNWSW